MTLNGDMATKGMDALETATLQAMLGPRLTAEQAALIFQQGRDAVVFALLTLAKQLAEKQCVASTPDPSVPLGWPVVAPPTQRGHLVLHEAAGDQQTDSSPTSSEPGRKLLPKRSDCDEARECNVGPPRFCQIARNSVHETRVAADRLL
jgi:hypothetical protein